MSSSKLSFWQKTTDIKPKETKAVLVSFLFAFVLMTAYSMLKPVRDAMSSDWSDTAVSQLWTFTFLFSFVAVSIQGFFASRISLKWLVPATYIFFTATFMLFYIVYQSMPEPLVDDAVELASLDLSSKHHFLGQTYYVWVSVFALFHLSVFWSFMTQIYTREQAARLFAFIATGASAGAIFGPIITVVFGEILGIANLVLLASIILLCSIPLTFYLNRLLAKTHDAGDTEHTMANKPLGGSLYNGFVEFVSNKKLLGIGVFIFIFTGISAFIYFAQKNVLVDFDRDVRAQIWAGLDLMVNIMTFVVGIFFTSKIVRKFGMAFSLSIVPFLVMAGLLIVMGIPSVWMIVGLQFVRKVGNYAVTKPSREMLFTAVDAESRFKAKPIIDIVIYRGGDVFWAWGFAILTDQFQLGLGQMALIGAIIAGVWGMVGVYLGKRH